MHRSRVLRLRSALLMFGLLAMTCGGSLLAATFVVNSFGDDVDATPGDGLALTAGNLCTLRAAIMEANALAGDDIIQLPAGWYRLNLAGAGEDACATGDLDIDDPSAGGLTIIGAARDTTIIDGLGGDRVFHGVGGQTLVISDLTVRGGAAPGSTGGVLTHTGMESVTFRRVRFHDNHASAGGVVFKNNGDLIVEDCLFEANLAGGAGGAIHKLANGVLSISRSQFVQQVASLGAGGAVFYSGNAPVTIANSSFTDCLADGSGGAVHTVSSAALTITDTLFDSNLSLATGGGGLFFGSGGAVPATLTNCTFMNNSASVLGGGCLISTPGDLAITGGRFEGCFAVSHGGGLAAMGQANVTIQNCVLATNRSMATGGGLLALSTGSVSFTGVTFSGNTANGRAGGMEVNTAASATFTNCGFIGNTAFGIGGGGLYSIIPGTLTISGSSFTDNIVYNNGLGGAVFAAATTSTTISSTTFSGNQADGPSSRGGALHQAPGPATLTNVTVSANSAGLRGGGIYAAALMTLTNCTLADNSALDAGGALYCAGAGTVTLYDTILTNSLAGGNCGGGAVVSGGGNISSDGACALGDPTDQINTNPAIGPLQDNGGPRLTHALVGGSPAIDTGRALVCPTEDGRGLSRPIDGNGDGTAVCDIGAFEFRDCNQNGHDDRGEIAGGITPDANGNNVPDNCDPPAPGGACGAGCGPGPLVLPLSMIGLAWMKRRGSGRIATKGAKEHEAEQSLM